MYHNILSVINFIKISAEPQQAIPRIESGYKAVVYSGHISKKPQAGVKANLARRLE
jgi:hypothetical protein